jgi:hypothetical protein
MPNKRADLFVLLSATAAWALFLYSGVLATLFWWVAPLILFGTLSTLLVCNLLEARPLLRPILSLAPPAIALPYFVVIAWHDREFGLLPVAMLVYPTLVTAAVYFMVALYNRIRSNNSFKPNTLRGGKVTR